VGQRADNEEKQTNWELLQSKLPGSMQGESHSQQCPQSPSHAPLYYTIHSQSRPDLRQAESNKWNVAEQQCNLYEGYNHGSNNSRPACTCTRRICRRICGQILLKHSSNHNLRFTSQRRQV